LKPIDIVVLKKLSEVVNVVPVIAKSDSLTIEERQAFKQRVCILYFKKKTSYSDAWLVD
jgi:septin family protein